ncbi:penicillin-binding protein [Methylobacterium sp. NPDC080182]|uniref:penicillin-binding protein n=1 Tax=Methylobacterium sp. NPDC080182 TaxID=3390590 RepID=UPI003D005125
MSVTLSRRSAIGGLLAMTPMPAIASRSADPFPGTILRAEAADAAYRESGRLAQEIQAAGQGLPPTWRAYRAILLRDRTVARTELHALTPTTLKAAAALVSYYRTRAETSGDPRALHAARRRLRKVFRRPGAIGCPIDLDGDLA